MNKLNKIYLVVGGVLLALSGTMVLQLPVAWALDTEEATSASPLVGQGIAPRAKKFTAEEIEELQAIEATMKRFEENARSYRAETRKLIEFKYKRKRDTLYNSYETLIVDLEKEQRVRRQTAISRFERFVRRYPDDVRYTPDAMFRLSELYFERSYDDYFQARRIFDDAIDKWAPESAEPEPTEPTLHYERTIAMMQRLIVEFPKYRLVDGAYYLLGYCLGEQGEDDRAVDVYHELVAHRSESRFAPEVWTRIGEYYFDTNELTRALDAYNRVLETPDSPYYDKALYKLAWTHYRLADPERAPEEYQRAVDSFVALLEFNERTKAEGKERGTDLRNESVQYIAISFADEDWGGTDKAVSYLQSKSNPPYEREVLTALGDVYFDQTRYTEAVEVYSLVQGQFPLALDAPQVQQKIVDSLERDRNFEGAAEARQVLTANYSEGAQWYDKYKDDEEALSKASKLTEKSLYSAALFHHRQAQIHKDAEKIELAGAEYRKAATAYGEYLRKFPHDKQLYELTFYHAECLYYSLQFTDSATEYAKVRDSNVDNKFLEDSAFSVILSYENRLAFAKRAGEVAPVEVVKSSEREAGVPITPKEIPEQSTSVVQASDRYASLLPNSDKLPKILYKAAHIFYVYDHLEEARMRFTALLEAYPHDEVAEFASNLVIESYMAENDFGAVEKFSRGLLERPSAPGGKEFRADLIKFKSGAMFKIAEDLFAREEYEKAATEYLSLLKENPKTEFAASAMNNAALAFEKVSRFDSASRLYERLVREHPKSALADSALFRVGINAERFFDFERAIGAYLKLIDAYPQSPRRADAIYNAALSLENLQNYERSAKQYLRYCKLFPNRDDAPNVCFRAGTVYQKMGDSKRVISTYDRFIKKYRRSDAHRDRIIEAWLRIGKANEDVGNERKARKAFQSAIKEFSKDSDSKSAAYAAEAQFELVEREFEAFVAIKFGGTAKQQQKTVMKKAKALKSVESSYRGILVFKRVEWTLAALFRIGQLYQDFAESMIAAPCPKEVKRSARAMGVTVEEVCDEYKILLEEQAANLEDKAVEAYENVITRAREFQVANEWTKRTLVALNKLRRSMYPLQKPAKFHLDAGAVVPLGVYDDKGEAWSAAEPEPAPQVVPPTAVPAQPATVEDATDAPPEVTGAPPPPPPLPGGSGQ